MTARSFHLPDGWQVTSVKNIDGIVMISLYHAVSNTKLLVEERPEYLQEGIDKEIEKWQQT